MAQTVNRLRSIAEGELPPEFLDPAHQPDRPQPPPSSTYQSDRQQTPAERAAASMLLASLRALSQRTIIAVSNLFVLATAASAFWLWLVTLPNPSIQQLVGLALYGILVLSVDWLVLRRR